MCNRNACTASVSKSSKKVVVGVGRTVGWGLDHMLNFLMLRRGRKLSIFRMAMTVCRYITDNFKNWLNLGLIYCSLSSKIESC